MYFRGQQFDYGDAAKIKNLISISFIRKLREKPGMPARDFGKKCRTVFIDFLGLMMDDIIENNNVFVSPNSLRFRIKIAEKGPKESDMLSRALYSYQDVDLIASDGKFYHFVMCFEYPKIFYKPIRISRWRYKKIVDNVNAGKRYHLRP